jgi:hypothetical protein
MVGPTNEKPRFFRSRDSARDSPVSAEISAMVVHRFTMGVPSTNDHR